MASEKSINVTFTLPDQGFRDCLFFNRLAATVTGEGAIVYVGYSPNNNDPKKWFGFYFSNASIKDFQDSAKAYLSQIGLPQDVSLLASAPEYIDCPIIPADTILLSKLKGNCEISLYAYSYHPVVNRIRAKKTVNEPLSSLPIAILRSTEEAHKRFTNFLLGIQT